MSRDRFAYIFSGIVVCVWIMVLTASVFTRDYTGVTIMTPLLMMVAGFLLGYGPKGGGDG